MFGDSLVSCLCGLNDPYLFFKWLCTLFNHYRHRYLFTRHGFQVTWLPDYKIPWLHVNSTGHGTVMSAVMRMPKESTYQEMTSSKYVRFPFSLVLPPN